MIRIDIRARVDDLDNMTAALERVNFKKLKQKIEHEIHYCLNDGDLKDSEKKLCLFCEENISSGEKKASIIYKCPGTDRFSITDVEYETEIADFEAVAGIFDHLGYNRAAEIRKDRRYFSNFEGVSAYLDEVRQLGKFLELEILLDEESRQEYAVEALAIILNELGVHKSAVVTKTYIELLK